MMKKFFAIILTICILSISLFGCVANEEKGHEVFYYSDFNEVKTILNNNVNLQSNVFKYQDEYSPMRTEYLICDFKEKFLEIKDENGFIINGVFPPHIIQIDNIDHYPTIGVLYKCEKDEMVLISVKYYPIEKEYLANELNSSNFYYTMYESLPNGAFYYPKLYEINKKKGCLVKSFVKKMQNKKSKYAKSYYTIYSEEDITQRERIFEVEFFYKKHLDNNKKEYINRDVEYEEKVVNYYIENFKIWSNWGKHEVLKDNE